MPASHRTSRTAPTGAPAAELRHHALRAALVDARRAVPEPPHRLRRQLEPERRAPDARARPRRDRVPAAVGRRRLLARVRRPAVLDRRASATGSAARVRCSSAWRRSSSRRRAASQSTTMWQLIACRAVMGARRGASSCRRRSRSSSTCSPPRERAKAIAIWAATTGVAGAIGPVASGWLLGHFWYGSIFLINLPIIAVALVGGWFLVPKSKDPEQGALDPGRRGALDRRHLDARVRADRGARQGLGRAGDARRVRGRRGRARALRRVGAARRRADARHPLLPQPELQHRQRRDDPRVPRDVRRHVPDDAVLPARPGLHGVVGGAAPPADGAHHDHRRPADPAASTARFGAQPDRRVRHAPRSRSGCCCSTRSACTPRTGTSWSRSSRSSREWRSRCRR